MDNERARFILSSFRPNGADVNDADFADALKLAHEDRELGEWLSCERAFDAEFADALSGIALPSDLREEILASLAVDRSDFPQAQNSADSAMIGAFSAIQPPPGFREKLIAAMEVSAPTTEPTTEPKNVVSFWKKYTFPAAAAAGIALAFFMTQKRAPDSYEPIAENHRISSNIVEANFVKTFQAPDFTLERTHENYGNLCSYLCNNGLPHPATLPPGLKQLEGLGCRELLVDGKRGALICFNSATGIVHLVVFKRDDLMENGPFDKPEFEQNGEWSYARWQDEQLGYLLISKVTPQQLAGFF